MELAKSVSRTQSQCQMALRADQMLAHRTKSSLLMALAKNAQSTPGLILMDTTASLTGVMLTK